jgi:long-chain acyl-CoA synthetase
MNLEFDCGFDSLERVEFLSNVQDAFGISIDDDEAMTIFTVEDLSTAVAKGLVQTDRSVARSEKVSWAEILDAPLTEEETGEIHRVLRRRPVVEACYFFLSRCIWILGKLFFRLRFEGQEHLRQAQPHMICPNHLSYVDAFMISAGLPFSTVRRMFYVGYSDYFQPGSMTGYLGSLIKILPVDPDRNLRKALRLGAYGLKEQLVLGIFPEGERSIDGELRSFRKGPAVLARELGVVAIPTALIGTFQVWSRGSSRFRLHPVTVRFGKPIEPQPDESLDEFNARLKSSVKALLEGASQ